MRSNTGQILYIPRVGQRANPQHPLMRGCVGWWPLTDSGGGIAKDIISGGNDGTGSGGYSFGKTTRGYAAEFDGVNGTFDLGSGTDLSRNQTAMSCSAWISVDNATTSTAVIFYESNSLIWWQTRFTMRLSSGAIHCSGRDDDADAFTVFAASDSSQITVNNTWYHVVAVFDPTGGGCKVYRDGVDVTSSSDNTGNGFSDTASLVASLGSADSSFYFDGHIQNIRVYNRALSSSEVFELYINPWSGLSIPSETRYFFVPAQIQQIFPPRMKLKTSINLGKGGRIVI